MKGRRILYGVCLCGAIFYYIFHSGYYSWLLLAFVAGFLPVEIVLSLPTLLSAQASLREDVAEIDAGQPFLLQMQTKPSQSVCSVKATLHVCNLFTGGASTQKIFLRPGRNDGFSMQASPAHCGVVRCSLRHVRVLDIAGIVALPIKAGPSRFVLVRPSPLPPSPQLPPASGRQASLPQAGNAPGPGGVREYADVREFREDDLPRDIHWKLSAKWDKLMVREASAPQRQGVRLGFDCGGTTQDMNHTLARLQSLSIALHEMESPHEVLWNSGGSVQCCPVQSGEDFDAFLRKILSQPLPESTELLMETAEAKEGPLFLVTPDSVSLYEHGTLREVLA